MKVNIVEVDEKVYALPSSCVKEVAKLKHVTPLPFAPHYVDGLVNVSGEVVAQIDLLRRLTEAGSLPKEQGQLIVIESGGIRTALHISQAVVLTDLNDEQFEPLTDECSSDEAGFIAGQIRWLQKTVLLLSPEQLGIEDIEQPIFSNDLEGLISVQKGYVDGDVSDNNPVLSQQHRYMVVTAADEWYAFPMQCVKYVQERGDITLVPSTGVEVLGMMYTHGEPCLVLGLERLIHNGGDTGNKLVIVEHNGVRCSFSIDNIVGIKQLRVQDDNHDALVNCGLLEGYLVDSEERLVGALNIGEILSEERTRGFKQFLFTANKRVTQNDKIANQRKCSLLTFRVGSEECALPLEKVNRVVQYSQCGQVPEGGEAHLNGVVQIQGEVYPVSDLRRQFSPPGAAVEITSMTAFIVAGNESQQWALAVDQVHRVMEVAQSDVEAMSRHEKDYIESIGRINGILVSILDLDALTEQAKAA